MNTVISNDPGHCPGKRGIIVLPSNQNQYPQDKEEKNFRIRFLRECALSHSPDDNNSRPTSTPVNGPLSSVIAFLNNPPIVASALAT